MGKCVRVSWGGGQTDLSKHLIPQTLLLSKTCAQVTRRKMAMWGFSDVCVRGPQISMVTSLLGLIFTIRQWV